MNGNDSVWDSDLGIDPNYVFVDKKIIIIVDSEFFYATDGGSLNFTVDKSLNCASALFAKF